MREKTARELVATSEEPGQALSSGSSFRRASIAKGFTAEAGAPAQTSNLFITQNILNHNCVTESWRSVQSEMHQEKVRFASEVEAMQVTANVKHEEIVHQVAQVSWDAARQQANAAIDMNEEQCWVAVRQAEAVAEYCSTSSARQRRGW